jgi:membrane-associated protease RseP (regulator of RpoE activity)
MISLRKRILRNFILRRTVLRNSVISIGTLAAFSCAAFGQAPAPTSTTVTTTTSRMSASPTLNTNTNSQPDVTGWSGHPDTDIRIRDGAGKLGVAMANFSVRTGLEVRPNKNAQAVVQRVRPETPAARAGVEPGDIIAKVDGKEVATFDALQALLMRRPTQPAFLLKLQRGDQAFRVPLGRQLTLMGMTLFPDQADRPVVSEIDPSSPAAFAGFQTGDVIVGFNHQMTSSMDRMLDFGIPFIRSVPAGQGLAFQVARDGKMYALSITRPADADLPVLTPDQERHLRRMGTGVNEPAPRPVISQTTTSMTQTVNPLVPGVAPPVGSMVVPAAVPVGVAGGVPQSIPYNTAVTQSGATSTVVVTDGLGLGLPTQSGAGVGPDPAQPETFGPLHHINAAVAMLYGKPSNMVQQTLMPSPNAPTAATVTATTPGINVGVVGFVQIQLTAPPTPVNPPPRSVPPVDSNNPPAMIPPQSLVSARVNGVPTGVYTLAVNEFGDCGDAAGASAGRPAITLGTLTVDANGQGRMRPQTVNYSPQAVLGRVVSLVPAGVLPPPLPPGQPQPTPPAGVQANASLACGVFGVSNPRRAMIADALPPAGVPSSTVTTGAPAPAPPAPVPYSPPVAPQAAAP